ncbi:AAA family ATPase [Ideonella sp. A 288]|uniref:AAA family ATPase n=1 Tax=Ideonella sp. A 288 TaxID=1962181 RepID=UPI000B4B5B41|nr:AAA family ATPase [Ideonella sp. A 288]
MTEQLVLGPYEGNILQIPLGSIHSREEALERLIELPKMPINLRDLPRHIRVHHLMGLRDFHVPPLEEGRLFESIDLMVRSGYHYRDPRSPGTFGVISGELPIRMYPRIPAHAAAVEGASGTGKTQGCLRSLNLYRHQTFLHGHFPGFKDPHFQVTHLSADVPSSGTAEDFARVLMRAWQQATGSTRFDHLLKRDRFRNPMEALNEWRQVAISHFLGILHLDEVQNFFKLATLEQRRRRDGKGGTPELSIVEDRCLKWILELLNTWGIPVLFSGTSDGIGALTKRLSNLERFGTGGYHSLSVFDQWDDPAYRKQFLGQLGRYQYTMQKLKVDDDLAKLILELSGGIPRVIVALWVSANRLALERPDDKLTTSDFVLASQTYLGPLAPAIAAVRSKDPLRMRVYEDLVSQDTTFWSRLWGRVGQSSPVPPIAS